MFRMSIESIMSANGCKHKVSLLMISLLMLALLLEFSCECQANSLDLKTQQLPSNQVSSDDLVRIHESPSTVGWSGVKQTDLAPESRVVGVYFDTTSLNIATELLKTNKSKQSQDFEIHNQTSSTTSTELPPTSSESSVSSTTNAEISPTISTTEASTERPPVTPSQDSQEIQVVASKTSRQGSAVFCGEGNPNGKSKARLVPGRIVGGQKTEPGEFPFQVRLNIRSRRGSGICGGVILDQQHILTAAHCMTACVSQHLTTATIENTGVHATIGDHSIRSNDGEVEVDIEKIIPHEKYDACNFYANDHDIALIKTAQPIEYRFTTDGYGSINRPCMPANSSLNYKEGDQVIVSGWGVTRENSGSLSNILRYVQVPIVNVSRCQETYGSRVTNDHVCAGFQSGGKDSCQGDSGGPLVRVVDNRFELVGIVSFGYGCGQPGAPGVYTRVASYIDWIKANL